MSNGSAQKWVGRNRPPRVQINYDVEIGDAEKVRELPFVMGVLADLAGKPAEPLPAVAERKMTTVDVDNFETFLKEAKPRVAFPVPNTITGDGNLSVDITFERMEDFSPAAVARKTEGLRQLLEAREQLDHLQTHLDGKQGAVELLNDLLKNKPEEVQALGAGAEKPKEE